MKHFLVKYGITAAQSAVDQAVRVDFVVPVITDGEWPVKSKSLKATKVLLVAGELTNTLPKNVFGMGLLGKTYYVPESLNVLGIVEVSPEEYAFHFGLGL